MTGTILIADASATNRITLKVKLEGACYRVCTAGCVERAVEAARTLRPDLILAEAGLPGGGAEGLCRHLQAARPGEPPVIAFGGAEARLPALRAGASEVLEKPVNELFLLARIRQLLANATRRPGVVGLAEEAAPFAGLEPAARVTLIAQDAAMALGWKHALTGRGRHDLAVSSPEAALTEASEGTAADLYLIAADLARPGDGLRLLSELRARPASRDAAFLVALAPERAALAPVALDLGAGDVLPLSLGTGEAAEEAALRLSAQLSRKRRADRRRAEEERERMWAVVDPLTGLHNRRYALPRLAALVAEAQARPEGDLAVMLLDLDRFKAVNDGYGHAAGDAVLTAVARRLADCLRPGDLLARIGGEEFLVALSGPAAAEALRVAERLRQAVAGAPVPLPARLGADALRMTCSIGVSRLSRADDGPGAAEALLDRADRALLAAKARGRDRVIIGEAGATAWAGPPSTAGARQVVTA